MAREEVARLFRAARSNASLRDRLNAAPDVEYFVRQAREFGYDFTIEEWREMTRFSVEEVESQVSEIPGI
jgi:predicted ribosomally synthesized peptide with nif11-like leader